MTEGDATRQRRTVVGLLEDLEAKIQQKKVQVAGAESETRRLLAELQVMEAMYGEWQEIPKNDPGEHTRNREVLPKRGK
mgnify:CR=1 FL=1|jgi:hypothetical protein|tara:strand:- start:3044 stop:3280 length:237 start_codon:yes stop_codon:yes gene_type:complete